MAAMMPPFQDLGRRVDRAWEAADFNEQAFPLLVAEALAVERLPERLTGDAVLQWVLDSPVLPVQEDLRASFGQPPITVYRGRRFHIQVLYWLDGSTTIHRHGFCGAFQVLDGGSLHTRWRFEAKRRVNSHMLLGQTVLLGSEILRRGDIVSITPDLTHGLFHLDAPSVTIVVRTDGEAADGPQYEYHPPTIALDPFFVDPLVERQLQVCHLLRASGHEKYDERMTQLVTRLDLHTIFRLLHHAMREGASREQLDKWAENARPRHGDAIDEIRAALSEGMRRRALHGLRRQIRESEGRFFLALLQNLPDREAILGIIRAEFPDKDPLVILRNLVHAHASRLGVDTSEDLERILVNSLLEDADEGEIFRRLGEIFDTESLANQHEAVLAQTQRMRQSLLAPLFMRGAS